MPVTASGNLSLLRVHDRGTSYGPPSDQIAVVRQESGLLGD
jgi:hypothetical protein